VLNTPDHRGNQAGGWPTAARGVAPVTAVASAGPSRRDVFKAAGDVIAGVIVAGTLPPARRTAMSGGREDFGYLNGAMDSGERAARAVAA
jgi:hypothetical protein